MALTRKFLASKGVEADVIDEIIAAHADTISGLKDSLDECKKYESKALKYDAMRKELEELKAKVNENKDKDYDALKKEFDTYKQETKEKELNAAKESAYRKILKDLSVPEKHFDRIVKYTDLKSLELDDKGEFKNASVIAKDIKEEWGDVIETRSMQKSNPANPPQNAGSKALSKDEIKKIKDTTERQKAWGAYLSEKGAV